MTRSTETGAAGAGSSKEEISLEPRVKTGRQDVAKGQDADRLLCTKERHLSPQGPADMETGNMFIRKDVASCGFFLERPLWVLLGRNKQGKGFGSSLG